MSLQITFQKTLEATKKTQLSNNQRKFSVSKKKKVN